ncbi:MAG: hypothetical protein HRU35_08120 [Rickettsiaceae bacterium]|nr:hypothetical protein [Rickettsiaceae bacterium]
MGQKTKINKRNITKALELYNSSNKPKTVDAQKVIKNSDVVVTLPSRKQRIEFSMLYTIEDILAYLCSKLEHNNKQSLSVANIKKITNDLVNKITSYEQIVKTHGIIRSKKYISIITSAFELTDKYKVNNAVIKQALLDSDNQQKANYNDTQSKYIKTTTNTVKYNNSDNKDSSKIKDNSREILNKYKLLCNQEMNMKLQQKTIKTEFYDDLKAVKMECIKHGLEKVIEMYDRFIAGETKERLFKNTINKNNKGLKDSNLPDRYNRGSSVNNMYLA